MLCRAFGAASRHSRDLSLDRRSPTLRVSLPWRSWEFAGPRRGHEAALSPETVLLFDGDTPLFLLREYYKNRSDETSFPLGMFYPLSNELVDYWLESQMAGVLSEGLLDFLLIPAEIDSKQLRRMMVLLQATRSRIFFTDYIICPSCGRTLFDIEKTAEMIKKHTSHLKGLKIGVMGCIVNGPGEMADADFGYVGSGPGKIDLYCGQERVCRNIKEDAAVDRLIQLIGERGNQLAVS